MRILSVPGFGFGEEGAEHRRVVGMIAGIENGIFCCFDRTAVSARNCQGEGVEVGAGGEDLQAES